MSGEQIRLQLPPKLFGEKVRVRKKISRLYRFNDENESRRNGNQWKTGKFDPPPVVPETPEPMPTKFAVFTANITKNEH